MFEVILQYICLLVNVTFTIGRPYVNYSNLHYPPHLSLNLSQIFYTYETQQKPLHMYVTDKAGHRDTVKISLCIFLN